MVSALAIVAWYEAGKRRSRWPQIDAEDWAHVVVLQRGRLLDYENKPYAQPIEDKHFAWGSGKLLALGAMAAGATAQQAVDIASRYHVECGLGVDVFDLAGRQLEP